MAMGDTYNNNEKKKYDPVVYSSYGMSNPESTVDPTQVSFSFWNNFLKLSIAPKIPNSENYDYKSEVAIHLHHINARILADEIRDFKQDPTKHKTYGVKSGMGTIYITNGYEFGVEFPCLVIKKLSESGDVESSAAYEFNLEKHYAIRNYDEKAKTFDKVPYKDIEIDELITLLEEYCKAQTGAVAYSVVNNMKYDMSRINTKTELIAEKLGITFERKGGNKGGGTSFFDNSNSSGGSPKGISKGTLDDIDDLID